MRVEARALARLSHPHVGTVHRVGVDRGRTYIAMTLVDGADLRAWAQEPGRTREDLLRVFAEAGAGLVAAHAAGVVHRDFKPSNVLVDRTGRARVADFGIATLGPISGVDDMLSTQPGVDAGLVDTRASCRVGTPAYMAPEQHEGTDVGPASDQFAFCVALVDVLDGRLPFSATTASGLGADKAAGAIVRPSDTSISETMWKVIERGLAPRPEDRFASMAALLQALEHSRREGARRRVRVAVVAGIVAVAAAVGMWRSRVDVGNLALAAADPCTGFEAQLRGIWDPPTRAFVAGAFRQTELPHAEDAWQRVRVAFDAQATGWVRRKTNVCRAERAGQISAQAFDAKQSCLTARLSELRAATGVLRGMDRGLLLREQHLQPGEPIETCDATWDAYWLQRQHPEDVEGARAIEAELVTAQAQRQAGQIEEAKRTFAAIRQRIAASSEGFPSVRAELARRQSQLEPDPARKQAFIDEALTESLRTHFPRVTVPSTMDAAQRAREQGDLERAREWVDLGLAENRRYATVFAEDPSTAYWTAGFEGELQVQRGLYFDRRGQPREALAAYEASERALRPVADRFPNRRVIAFNNIAEIHRMLGDFESAGRAYDEAVAIARRDLGEHDPLLAAVLGNRAGAAIDAGHPATALDDLRTAIAILEGTKGEDAADLVVPVVNLGLVHAAREAHADARAAFSRAEAIAKARLGPGHPFTAYATGMLGVIDRETGQLEDALSRLDAALEVLTRTFPNGHALTAGMLTERAATLVQRGRLDAAGVDLDAAIAMLEATGGSETAGRAVADTVRAQLALARDDHAAAQRHVEAAIARLTEIGPADRAELVAARELAEQIAADGMADD